MKSFYEKPYESQNLPPQGLPSTTTAIPLGSSLSPKKPTSAPLFESLIQPKPKADEPVVEPDDSQKPVPSIAPPAEDAVSPSIPVKKPVPVKAITPVTPAKTISKPIAKPIAKPTLKSAPSKKLSITAPASVVTSINEPTAAPGSQRVLIVGRIVATVITFAMIGLIGRVAHLQISPPPQLAPLIGSQHSTTTLMGRRGTITDREGRILATTGIAHRLYVDPHRIVDPGTFPELLGYALGYDPAKIGKRLYELADKRYVVIDQKLDDEQWLKLESIRSKAAQQKKDAASATTNVSSVDDVQWRRLSGLYTDLWLERQYPQGAVGGHVIGFVGQEGHGFEGAERIFNKGLTATSGKLGYLRDAGHRAMDIDIDTYEQPKDGQSIRLSIDITIQAIAEAQLAKACKEFGAKTGEMVIMDPYTGEIIAMANYPAFDPNEVRTTKPETRRNRCVTDPFEPGSTFKPFIWAAAVEQGFAKPEQMINTDESVGRALRDTHDHGTISWAQVLIKSSNRGMAVMGNRMGSTKLYNAVKSFGFGELTHTGFPGESRGMVNPLRSWNPQYSPTSVPMGQEIAVTPLQLCRAFCVFANGGYLVSPTIQAKDPNDPRSLTVVQRVLSPRTTQITKDIMRQVVTDGTGRKANSSQYALFGKTGTAQIAKKNGGGYEPNAYSGVFVGGAPLDKPRLVIACAIHKPDVKKGYYGGIVAAPAVMHTFEQSLNYLGVAPLPAKLAERDATTRLAIH